MSSIGGPKGTKKHTKTTKNGVRKRAQKFVVFPGRPTRDYRAIAAAGARSPPLPPVSKSAPNVIENRATTGKNLCPSTARKTDVKKGANKEAKGVQMDPQGPPETIKNR